MKATKRISLLLIFVILLTSFQSCTVNHSNTNKFDAIHYRVSVNYDWHVEYGEIISLSFSMGKIGNDSIIKRLLDDNLEISIRDSEHYEVVGQSKYIIADFIDEKYNVVDDNLPITVKFDVKITSPNYEEEYVIIDVKYLFEPGPDIIEEINDGIMEHEIPAFKFLSDDDGVTVYYIRVPYDPYGETVHSR